LHDVLFRVILIQLPGCTKIQPFRYQRRQFARIDFFVNQVEGLLASGWWLMHFAVIDGWKGLSSYRKVGWGFQLRGAFLCALPRKIFFVCVQ